MTLTQRQNNSEKTRPAIPAYGHRDGYRDYPPFVLIFGDTSTETTRIKRTLERNGCKVSQVGPIPENLATVYPDFFDLIVLNLEQPQAKQLDELWAKLRTEPKLSNIPLAIIVGKQDISHLDLDQSCLHPSVYCLSKDVYLQTKLLQIVQQTQYLSYRYM